MCGIVGFAGEGTTENLKKMMHSIEHRGPNESGFWVDDVERVFLGHQRLSILDIATGKQPMSDRSGNVHIIFNGQIYNHLQLRTELEALGHRFLSKNSDTEVLLLGYIQWGQKVLERLNGMWAFAIYDQRNRQLFLARDRFGEKPLYYCQRNGSLLFASELTALIEHPAVTRSLSKKALQKYFAYSFIPSPLSIYEDVYKLPAGHCMLFDLSSQKLKIERYWKFVLDPFTNISSASEKNWCDEIISLLRHSVDMRLRADVDVGVFLSGGVDSTTITSLAAEVLRKSGRSAPHTFSVGFDEKSFDESHYAKFVAETFKTTHHQIDFKILDLLQLAPTIASKLDEPFGDSSLLPTFVVSQLAQKHVKVVLGGDGSDELFAGYDTFKAIQYAKNYSKFASKGLNSLVNSLVQLLPVRHSRMTLGFKLNRFLMGMKYQPQYWNPIWLSSLEPQEIQNLFPSPIDLEDLYSEALASWRECEQENIVDKTLQYYIDIYLQNDILYKTDRAGMMNSLEIRSPFLDLDLVNLVRKIPHQYKIKNGTTKYILKKAIEDICPSQVIHRPKQGFGVPIGSWFQSGALSLNSDSKFVQDKLSAHRDRHSDHRLFLWNEWIYNQLPKSRFTN